MKRLGRFRVAGAAFVAAASVLAASLLAANGAETPSPAGPAANQDRIQVAQAAADKPVSYAENQATRGARLYKSVCADCHGEDLRGGLIGGPPLRGSAFEKKFAKGAPASVLFAFISGLMPPDAPGQYSPGEYVDVVAFILKEHGFQAGAPLPTDPDALDHLIVEK